MQPEPDHWYHCPECSAAFSAQIPYERHLFTEHNLLRDLLPAIVDH